MEIDGILVLKEDEQVARLIQIKRKFSQLGITGPKHIWEAIKTHYPTVTKHNIMPYLRFNRKPSESIVDVYNRVLELETKRVNKK